MRSRNFQLFSNSLIGCGFEAELRAELKKENEIELGRLKDLMRIENEKEIEKLNLKLDQQQQNYNQQIRFIPYES